GVPAGPAAQIAALYREIAQAITEGRTAHPGFDTAVHHHRTLAAIERAAQTGVRQALAPPPALGQAPAPPLGPRCASAAPAGPRPRAPPAPGPPPPPSPPAALRPPPPGLARRPPRAIRPEGLSHEDPYHRGQRIHRVPRRGRLRRRRARRLGAAPPRGRPA